MTTSKMLWTILSKPYTDTLGRRVVDVQCACGTSGVRNYQNIKRGLSTSCGCTRRLPPVRPGHQYGDWTVLRVGDKHVVAECACGWVNDSLNKYSLLKGDSRSCGHEKQRGYRFQDGTVLSIRGHNNRGRSRAKLRRLLKMMVSRCTNPDDLSWENYGARGISVCTEWVADPERFVEWALDSGYVTGQRLQIDRIDVNGNYEPDNCRWVSPEVNARNKRNTVTLTAWGETKPLMDWVEDSRCQVSEGLLRSRVERGWQHEVALTARKYMKKDAAHTRTV